MALLTAPTMKRLLKFLGLIAGFVALLTLIWANRTGKFEPRPYQDKTMLVPAVKDAQWPAKTITVTLGVYVQKVYDFEVQPQSFLSEGWVWLVWPQEFQDLLDAGKIPVEGILDAMNLDRTSNFAITAVGDAPRSCRTAATTRSSNTTASSSPPGSTFGTFPSRESACLSPSASTRRTPH